ncbi:sigma-54-dependent Fis family transcriptional regulator [candidate division KSB1 bacterium]|nr:sigma-54-dependent Fis family transcriptional regulator [candidate division KSB1 bacterium]
MAKNEKREGLNQSLLELQTLNHLAQTISSTMDVDKIINAIIKEATDLTGARQGSILLSKNRMDSRFTTLVRVGTNRYEALVHRMTMIIAGWILKHKESLLVEDILKDDRFKGLEMLGYPMESVLAAPIQARGRILGVLILHGKKEEHPFQENDLRLVNIIASQSAHVLENAELLRQLKDENQHLQQEVERKYSFHEIIGRGPAMEKVFKLLDKVIPTDARVLINGESGTGKELIARAIHYNSERKKHRFVAVDCGALPENLLESELFGHLKGSFTGATESKKGLFKVADGGTLFLDEINNTSPALQAKLLRVIQEGEVRPVGGTNTIKVDVRIVSATSKDLAQCVKEGTFREDLFFRLKVVPLKLPPLRERKEDIPILANHFLGKYNKALKKKLETFDTETTELLTQYHWPGNVRELENCIERIATLAEPDIRTVTADLLPDEVNTMKTPSRPLLALGNETKLERAVELLERTMVKQALGKFEGNRTRAAAHLGLSRRGLLNKIERYELE